MRERVVLIGAGSAMFTRGLVADLLRSGAEVDLALVDVDPVALESQRIGHGGDHLLAQITGMNETTIRRGREELEAELADCPPERVRQPGAGRPPVEKKIQP